MIYGFKLRLDHEVLAGKIDLSIIPKASYGMKACS
jgi:hypothetical protein